MHYDDRHFAEPSRAEPSRAEPSRAEPSRRRILGSVLVVVPWFLSCADAPTDPGARLPAVVPVPTTVTVTPSLASLSSLGETAQLAVQVLDQNGNAMAGVTVTWSSSAADVATVSGAGLVTSTGNGGATITALAGTASGTATVRVQQLPAVTGIAPDSLNLAAPGDTATLLATVSDANGNVIEGAEVAWASADPGVATVAADGLVTAVSVGSTTVTATAGDAEAETAIVVELRANSITVSPAALRFAALGDTERLTATVTDASGHPINEAVVTWSTADSSVATVDHAGLVTAAGYGVTRVTATHDSLTASADVEVSGDFSGDRQVLEFLYRAWNGDNWNDRTNWLSDAPLSDWAGVDTDGNGRVDYLRLRDRNLEGRIPAAIGQLDQLLSLDLNDNSLHGPVPPEVGWLTRLHDLHLSGNDLSGPLPAELGDLAGLRYLDLSYTNLSGPIPETFSRLALEHFYFGVTWLCVPPSLNAWLARIGDADERVPCVPVTADRDVLVALYEATGGNDWDRNRNWLSDGGISTWYGVKANDDGYVTEIFLPLNNLTGSLPSALGDLAHIERLSLYGNELTGEIPPELGQLTSLRDLSLSSNELTGSIPRELGNLVNVDTLYLSNNQLSGPIPPELGNMAALERLALFENRLSGPLPKELGKLKKLRDLWLSDNAIEGPLPAELGEMTSLEDILLTRNQVSGQLPSELGKLRFLKDIGLQNNKIEGPIPTEWGNLAALEDLTLSINRLTGPIPRELGNLSNLEFLSLFENELSGEIPPTLGSLTKLDRLSLSDNAFTGQIPPELGNLSALTDLQLSTNLLSGRIPPELTALRSLVWLGLSENNLSGPLPAEIGELENLEHLWLESNPDLSGLLPRSMLNIVALGTFYIGDTGLCPQIDPEFQSWLRGLEHEVEGCDAAHVERLALSEFFARTGGDSWTRRDGWNTGAAVADWHGIFSRGGRVRGLTLEDNGLTGPVPPEVGNLTALETLDLGGNGLAGELPVVVASMADLTSIRFSGNEEMQGPLPFRLTDLTRLKALEYEATGMCASPGKTFQDWLGRIDVVSGATCGNVDRVGLSLPVVYLTQAIQRPAGDVPLIAGRDALLRVFLTSDAPFAFYEPEVVATFFHGGREVHRVVMQREGDLLATRADESELRNSYNAVIPGEHIRPGLEMTVEADPDGTVPLAAGSQVRFPASGTAAPNVIEVPPLELTVVPVLEAAEPDSSIFEWTDNIDDDSPEVGLFRYSFPFSEFTARSREPYYTSLDLTSDDGQWGLVLEMEALRAIENGTGYYYAAAASVNGYVRGRARLAAWASIGKAWDTELAHEVGHNLDLLHAPCGGALGTDPEFPYPNGGLGAWGYDFRDGSVVSAERRRDIMGYCYERGWLSDYYFEKVIEYRERVEGDRARAFAAADSEESEMLVLWGGVLNGQLRIEPAFRVASSARLPEQPGQYRIEGVADSGDTEFSLAFEPGVDKFGDKYFLFMVPIESGWMDSLNRITLTGPEGTVSVSADADRPITLVTDPATESVRAILRGWEGDLPDTLRRTGAIGVSISRGIRDAVRLER
ncbi:MAG: hypothetical protein F4Y73_04025 [Gemmatimonadetes bacterium]|nr:hypothetical protein [Gemmatimonadota bacterium]